MVTEGSQTVKPVLIGLKGRKDAVMEPGVRTSGEGMVMMGGMD